MRAMGFAVAPEQVFTPALAAVVDMGLGPGDVVMVGDDIEADIGGALAAGLKAVQVMTGKYSRRDDAHPDVRPTARVASIADLPDAVEALS